MRARSSGWWAAAMGIVALAACGSGGELKEATERRRLQQAGADSAGDSASARDEGRLPAFSSDSRPAAAARDTQPRAPTGQWTTGELDFQRPEVVATVRGMRAARNEGFDRIVIDFGPGAPLPGWHVEYLDGPATQCGSGEEVAVAGEGRLLVRLRTAQAHDDDGNATMSMREGDYNLPVLRQMAFTCDFEGDVDLVFGVAARSPFRVLELQNPSRLVVDVRH